jgi:hypothetical protein
VAARVGTSSFEGEGNGTGLLMTDAVRDHERKREHHPGNETAVTMAKKV